MRWLLAFFAAFPLLAHGSVVTRTLTFQDAPDVAGHRNFVYGGLRFSPSCNMGLVTHNDQISLHSDHDNSNCEVMDEDGNFLDELPNRDFLGTDRADFYIDRFGLPFTLRDIAATGHVGTRFWAESSRGGNFYGEVPYLCCEPEVPYVLPWQSFALTGPLWTDITWFQLHNGDNEGFGWQPHRGWDDIRYSYRVPEPPTWAIVLPGLLGLAFRRKFPKVFSPEESTKC